MNPTKERLYKGSEGKQRRRLEKRGKEQRNNGRGRRLTERKGEEKLEGR